MWLWKRGMQRGDCALVVAPTIVARASHPCESNVRALGCRFLNSIVPKETNNYGISQQHQTKQNLPSVPITQIISTNLIPYCGLCSCCPIGFKCAKRLRHLGTSWCQPIACWQIKKPKNLQHHHPNNQTSDNFCAHRIQCGLTDISQTAVWSGSRSVGPGFLPHGKINSRFLEIEKDLFEIDISPLEI